MLPHRGLCYANIGVPPAFCRPPSLSSSSSVLVPLPLRFDFRTSFLSATALSSLRFCPAFAAYKAADQMVHAAAAAPRPRPSMRPLSCVPPRGSRVPSRLITHAELTQGLSANEEGREAKPPSETKTRIGLVRGLLPHALPLTATPTPGSQLPGLIVKPCHHEATGSPREPTQTQHARYCTASVV